MQDTAAPKRNRRIYTLKNDEGIFQTVAKYQLIPAELVSTILGRDPSTIRKRMLSLYGAGILNRAQRDKLSPYLYFFSEKGGNYAAGQGYLPEARWIDKKAPSHLMHDLQITLFHLNLESALEKSGHTLTHWEQWRGALREDYQDPDRDVDLIPDAEFQIDDEPKAVLEVVKSYESGYRERESSLVRKLRAFKVMGVERVYITMPTLERVKYFLGKIEDDMKSSRFWVTDEASCAKNILGKIWWTPKDFRDKTYSIFK